MLSSSPTIHRFTPPTCTLEIKAKKSPLSRWTKKEALKKLHFRLSFDDPRIPESKQVTIKGNRNQLEQLHEAVSNYIQEFLQASFQLTNKPETDLESNLKSSTKPYLKRQGLVSHELFFGSLAYQTSEPQIKLSTVQLFDLVTALEEYSTQIATVPELATCKDSKIISLWAGITAAAIVAVGLTIIAIKSQSPRNIALPQKSEPSVAIPQLDDVISPQVSESAKKTTSQPQLNEPLSSTKKLPPPPAVDTPKPPPNIPDPAKYSLPEVASQSGFKISSEATIHSENKANSFNQQTKSLVTMAPKSTAISPVAPEKKANLDESAKNRNRQISKPDISQPGLSAKSATANDSDSNLALNGSIPETDQLKEVKAYFQDKWQPPAELKQSLEYRLILNTDGSVQRIVAIGKASEIYLDRTNIPLRGQSFISPLRDQESSIIRLLLNPDGDVTAFAE
jgi:Domain of unknown function (DUF4335)